MNTALLRSKIFMRFNTRSEFANALGVSRQAVGAMLNGKSEPNMPRARQIAEVLGLTDEEFGAIFLNSDLSNGKLEEVEHGKIDA